MSSSAPGRPEPPGADEPSPPPKFEKNERLPRWSTAPTHSSRALARRLLAHRHPVVAGGRDHDDAAASARSNGGVEASPPSRR